MLAGIDRENTFLEQMDFFRLEISQKMDSAKKSDWGQFFTPFPIANLMASLFSEKREVAILDAGAGIGSLSAALISQIVRWKHKPTSVTLCAYEIDAQLIPYLQKTLENCEKICLEHNIVLKRRIFAEDFIASTVAILNEKHSLFAENAELHQYNFVILNPPYHKLSSESEACRLLESAGIKTSNLYTAFLWLSSKLLANDGQLVAITPRSFCNGTYFKNFRQDFLKSMQLRHIHLFSSRDAIFNEEDVLQENIIFHAVKSKEPQKKIVVSSSEGDNLDDIKIQEVAYTNIVHNNDPDLYVHIPSDQSSQKISQQMDALTTPLEKLGISVSTGRVVDFRSKAYLTHWSKASNKSFPLIYPHNFAHGGVEWPVPKSKKYDALMAAPEVENLLVDADFYVLTKRFSAKEEKKRIVAAYFDPSTIPTAKVGFENHLNYFHKNGKGLPPTLAKGLALFLNSTLVDEYFRQFSGHTQVNASDLRKIKYPSEQQLEALGQHVHTVFPTQQEIDTLIAEALNMNSSDSVNVKKRIEEAKEILRLLNVPKLQLNDRSALTLLALADMKPNSDWKNACSPLLGITEMMDYFKEHFDVTYAPNTRETVRRQTVHQFLQMGLLLENPDDPTRPTNSPHTRYQLEKNLLNVLHSYTTTTWDNNLKEYLAQKEALNALHHKEREMQLIPVKLPDGKEIKLSSGGQNILIKQIIEEFCPRFTPGGIIVYIGDAGEKMRGSEVEYLSKLNVQIDKHGKMPDVIIHFKEKNWLILVEAVTSHGPIDVKRHNELKELFKSSTAGLVFVTAFESRKTLIKHLPEIAWETDVWVAESPTHLIHFNGERFLGPYEK